MQKNVPTHTPNAIKRETKGLMLADTTGCTQLPFFLSTGRYKLKVILVLFPIRSCVVPMRTIGNLIRYWRSFEAAE